MISPSARRKALFVASALAVVALPVLAYAAPGAAGVGEEPNPLPPINRGLVTALTTLTVFLVLLFILGKVAFGPIAMALKKREDKIRQDIADAEASRAKAEATLKELTARLNAAEAEARGIVTKAVAEAEKIGVSLKARAQQDAEEIREKAIKDIDNERVRAIAEIHEQAVMLSTTIAEKILKRSINAADQQDLVRSSLEQLGSVGRN